MSTASCDPTASERENHGADGRFVPGNRARAADAVRVPLAHSEQWWRGHVRNSLLRAGYGNSWARQRASQFIGARRLLADAETLSGEARLERWAAITAAEKVVLDVLRECGLSGKDAGLRRAPDPSTMREPWTSPVRP